MHKTLKKPLYAALFALLCASLEGGGVMLVGARIGMWNSGTSRTWDATYDGILNTYSWVVTFPELTVADVLKSTIEAKVFQATLDMGYGTVAFLRANDEGCEFQVQVQNGGWNKSARVRCKDSDGGLVMIGGYSEGTIVGRYSKFDIPYDYTLGGHTGNGSYFASNIRIVGPKE